MNRLTVRLPDDLGAAPKLGYGWPELADRLAAYEDTGLEPEEVEAAKKIVARLALADYQHNFQHERLDIAAYMRWITSLLKDAKEWWNGMVALDDEGDR